ncbi:MAG: hypothetical protein WCB68_04730 [Pyrinomonadaceae bacterium]
MHDCHSTKESLLDLVFDEMDELRKQRLLREVARCRECQAHYASLSDTINVFDQASASLLPEESFWDAHHNALRHKINAAARTPEKGTPLWRRLFAVQVRVPAPVAAALVLLLLTPTLMLFSRAPQVVVKETNAPAIEKTRTVEVPVIQEKIVNHVVYVERDRSQNRDKAARALTNASAKSSNATADSASEMATGAQASLSAFKPAGDVKLKIIKGGYHNEK